MDWQGGVISLKPHSDKFMKELQKFKKDQGDAFQIFLNLENYKAYLQRTQKEMCSIHTRDTPSNTVTATLSIEKHVLHANVLPSNLPWVKSIIFHFQGL